MPPQPAREAIPRTVWTRLFFVWTILWGAIVTPPLAVGLLIHNAFAPGVRTFKWWLNVWGRAILLGAGVRLRSDVRPELPEDEPFVLVANHQNMLDIVTCAVGIPHSYGYTPKESLRRMPVIGAVLRGTQQIFVDRTSPRKAVESVRRAAEMIRGGVSVLVYVEGERTFLPGMTDFLRGAFVLAVEAGVPLVPVVQLNNYAVIDERRRVARPGNVVLVVADPIPTAGLTREDIPRLMEQVRASMEAELERFHHGPVRPARPVGVSLKMPGTTAE